MIKGYYFITDSTLSRKGNVSDVEAAVAASVSVVQYREKCASSKKMYEEALVLRSICKDITFLINDRVDIALSVKADGVHLGQGDLPYSEARRLLEKNKIIGLTVHNVKEAKEAEEIGADYIAVSPVFATNTKSDAGKAVGVEMIRRIRENVKISIVAIGGIDLSNAEKVVAAGASGLCAISAVITKQDVKKEIQRFQGLF